MPRPRTRKTNPYIQRQMDARGCTDIKELSAKTGVPYGTLRHYADIDGNNRSYEAIIRDSYLLGVDPVEFILGVLGVESIDEVLRGMGVVKDKAS